MKFTVPPGNTLGVKLESDGTIYNSSKGTIEVTNRRHIAEIKRSAEKQNMDLIKETAYALGAGASQPDRFCQKCVFNNVGWVSTCVRCGAKLELGER